MLYRQKIAAYVYQKALQQKLAWPFDPTPTHDELVAASEMANGITGLGGGVAEAITPAFKGKSLMTPGLRASGSLYALRDASTAEQLGGTAVGGAAEVGVEHAVRAAANRAAQYVPEHVRVRGYNVPAQALAQGAGGLAAGTAGFVAGGLGTRAGLELGEAYNDY
jgi:hypothetical protein